MLLDVDWNNHMNGWGWTMMILWTVLWIGFLAAVAWAIVQWVRGGTPVSGSSPSSKTARELLDERLARGELDLDEYERRRRAIERPDSAHQQ